MVKKCLFCSKSLDEKNVVDVCVKCAHGIWDEKMFSAIKENMQIAKDKGDLHQGSVSETI